jgi:hypothetical protein
MEKLSSFTVPTVAVRPDANACIAVTQTIRNVLRGKQLRRMLNTYNKTRIGSGFLNGGHNWARTNDLIDVNDVINFYYDCFLGNRNNYSVQFLSKRAFSSIEESSKHDTVIRNH